MYGGVYVRPNGNDAQAKYSESQRLDTCDRHVLFTCY